MPWRDVCLSVRPSHAGIECKRLYVSAIFLPSFSPTILVFPYQTGREPLNGGVECKGVWKKSRFSTNRLLYLANDARYSHSYYGRQIGNRTQAFEWYRFEWPWVTSNPHFKVTILFNVKYLKKLYKIKLYLQWRTNRKSYVDYRTAPFSMILNNH